MSSMNLANSHVPGQIYLRHVHGVSRSPRQLYLSHVHVVNVGIQQSFIEATISMTFSCRQCRLAVVRRENYTYGMFVSSM